MLFIIIFYCFFLAQVKKSASEVKDLLKLSNAGINLRVEDLNGTSCEFEERMQSSQLSDEQIKICKEVRQKSKNRKSASPQMEYLEKKFVAAVRYHDSLMAQERSIIREEMDLSKELNGEIDWYLKVQGFDPKEYALVMHEDDNGQDKVYIAPKMPNGKDPCMSIRKSLKPWWRCENCQQ